MKKTIINPEGKTLELSGSRKALGILAGLTASKPAVKTVLIFDQCGQEPIKFLVVDGDQSQLNGIYGNAVGNDEVLENHLYSLVYDKDFKEVEGFVTEFPVEAVAAGAKVVVVGFLP